MHTRIYLFLPILQKNSSSKLIHSASLGVKITYKPLTNRPRKETYDHLGDKNREAEEPEEKM